MADPCDCGTDPIAALRTMFVDRVEAARIQRGQDPARRPVFLRLHGVARGRFTVEPNLPADLKVGLFAQDGFDAWVRFSSDTPSGSDFKTTVGIGIKLFGVAGKKLLAPDQDATTHDFILQNHDVFFVDDARAMCEFTRAGVVDGDYAPYLKAHPTTAKILDDMAKPVASVAGVAYWSVLPFAFGARYVKYKLEPIVPVSDPPSAADQADPFYMHAELRQRLNAGDVAFRFLVQLRTDDKAMPLDAATVRWEESLSAPVHVATLTLPKQDTGARGQAAYGENLAFNIWHALPEHAPVGSLAEVRKVVYQASADLRRDVNGLAKGEPSAPRGADPYPDAVDTRVVRAAIHPAIGVARVGDSASEFFIGPEVTEPTPTPAGASKDAAGGLKRQAARFRIFGFNAAGQVVGELTVDNCDLRWTAHVANRKPAWYRFQMAMDIPEAHALSVPLRNASVTGAARDALAIDPGPRSISGANAGGVLFDTGKFQTTPVALGELRTDDAGRLVYLPGHGVSGSPSGTPIYVPDDPNSFANADGWYDDLADGPVSAEVTIDGRAIPVEAAWVLSAPPNYAPDVIALRTLYDLLYDEYVQSGWLPFPDAISFARDVQPIVSRLSGLQWVNRGFATQFGAGARNDLSRPDTLKKLSHPPGATPDQDPYSELRRQVLNAFRPPVAADNNPLPWPWIYGDAMDVPASSSPRQNLSLSPTQYRFLQLWAAGHFSGDYDPAQKSPRTIDEVPLRDQPAMLDRAALHFCVADAFHPGCEVTWPIRHTSLFRAPFRVRARDEKTGEPNYGAQLTSEIALRPGGPLYAQGPGDLTRWMAVPWQMDTAMCRSGYDRDYDPYLPTFWPARVPNQVLSVDEYQQAIDPKRPRDERLAAFTARRSWTRLLTGSVTAQMQQMVRDFGKLGVVETRPGVPDDPDLPATMLVESPVVIARPPMAARVPLAATAANPEAALRERALLEAGWESEEQAESFLATFAGRTRTKR